MQKQTLIRTEDLIIGDDHVAYCGYWCRVEAYTFLSEDEIELTISFCNDSVELICRLDDKWRVHQ